MAVKRITPVNYAELYDYDPADTTASDKWRLQSRSAIIDQLQYPKYGLTKGIFQTG